MGAAGASCRSPRRACLRTSPKACRCSRGIFGGVPHGGHLTDAHGDRTGVPVRRAVTFVDSNIPMYLVGVPHPNKDAARRALDLCITQGERLVTSAEVMQEILHRYSAVRRF